MKARVLIVIMSLLMLCTGCGKSSGTQSSSESAQGDITPQPRETDTTGSTVTYGDTPQIEVVQSVAYLFSEKRGNELYVACEYKNISDCPCIVTGVDYAVSVSGKEVVFTSEQPASKYCIINPGEKFYHAAWKAYSCTETDTITIDSVSVKCEKSLGSRLKLTVKDSYIVQNYPNFASVSGNVHGASENVALNEMCMGFYDSADKLIGVWFFTISSEIAANKDKHFTTHLRALPIDGLADKAVRIDSYGYGFNV